MKNPDTQPHHNNFRGLLILNVLLLMILAAVTFGPSADAQNRGRGEYTMVSGGVNGSDSSAIYIIDITNQELIAVAYNRQSKVLDGIGFRDVGADTSRLTRRRNPSSE